jgi:hypothetical protein
MTIIPLAPPSLAGSSSLPGGWERAVPLTCPAVAHQTVNAPLFGLAPCGVLPATRVATGAVRSYRTFSPLPLDSPLRARSGRYIFCATFLQVALTGRYPAHCPAEFGLSSPRLRPYRLRRGKPLSEPATPTGDRLLAESAASKRAEAREGRRRSSGVLRRRSIIRRFPARCRTVRASCTDCCAACRSPRRSSRCSSRSRAACRPGTRARTSP